MSEEAVTIEGILCDIDAIFSRPLDECGGGGFAAWIGLLEISSSLPLLLAFEKAF
eukprot:CAMPEP_0206270368 /NCGR_PEP_ID=MMETSP0047_2-20121206/32829_1 /ASSEMBLY_ACC=CAM_ASM_000192 /TAXON_ID=195065 /ORGANISM="Chroomonas mesostigmatica_cf, Strain CCMP1168" /LENGTH=54 /DNA_ID=CAMNT_0053699001 /DNA_START=341 /DNA_END=502 /DNA_ORIENTATION=-